MSFGSHILNRFGFWCSANLRLLGAIILGAIAPNAPGIAIAVLTDASSLLIITQTSCVGTGGQGVKWPPTPGNLSGGQARYFDPRFLERNVFRYTGQSILSKFVKIADTSCQILRLKCTKFDFGWGSALDPTGGAYSAPPYPYLDLRGPPRNVALMILTPKVRK